MSFLRRFFSPSPRIFRFALHHKQPLKSGSTQLYLLMMDKASTSPLLNKLKYIFLVASGFITYKLINGKSLQYPITVDAASDYHKRKSFNFVADVVEKCAPAVVYIEIKDTRRFDFFTGKPQTVSNGSGFIIHKDGLILTNAHVVTNRPHAKVEVRLLNGVTYSGVVENVDMVSDLATVRISAKNLPAMELGKSSDLRPGEFVIAIGSPLALSNTVTFGVISSTHRESGELGMTDKDMVYLQTDAAITFGNSGGPLVNLDGEAIGINSMKVTAGISFAIPSDYVKEFLKKAENGTKTGLKEPFRKKYMGITMLTLTPQILHELKQRNEHVPADIKSGVLVWKVIWGSPAHSGGLNPGDIVLQMDGKEVKTANDVYAILSNSTSRTISMVVVRYGQKIELHVKPETIE